MGNDVFANKMEISCKAGDGKSICATPDVCFTPPMTPATPPGVPAPYPNSAFSSDCSGGTSTVKISGQEVMMKNKSFFKTSTGDEAGCAPKKNVISSKIKGKVYFNAWSMDVKAEGQNVVRNLDLTTHNHAAKMPPPTPPTGHIDGMAPPAPDPEHEIKCAIQKCDKADASGKPYDVSKTSSGKNKGKPMPPGSRCSALGSKKHKCVQETLDKKGMSNVGTEKTFDMRGKPAPTPCASSPGKGLGRRPDIIVGDPSAVPRNIDVYDAKFPCGPGNTARPVTGKAYMAAKRARNGGKRLKEEDAYQDIAGKGQSKVLTPEDCKDEKCD